MESKKAADSAAFFMWLSFNLKPLIFQAHFALSHIFGTSFWHNKHFQLRPQKRVVLFFPQWSRIGAMPREQERVIGQSQ